MKTMAMPSVATDGGFTVPISGVELEKKPLGGSPQTGPLPHTTLKTHNNEEFCNFVKSINYICKYVNRETDQAVFTLENKNDKVLTYETDHYISSS